MRAKSTIEKNNTYLHNSQSPKTCNRKWKFNDGVFPARQHPYLAGLCGVFFFNHFMDNQNQLHDPLTKTYQQKCNWSLINHIKTSNDVMELKGNQEQTLINSSHHMFFMLQFDSKLPLLVKGSRKKSNWNNYVHIKKKKKKCASLIEISLVT